MPGIGSKDLSFWPRVKPSDESSLTFRLPRHLHRTYSTLSSFPLAPLEALPHPIRAAPGPRMQNHFPPTFTEISFSFLSIVPSQPVMSTIVEACLNRLHLKNKIFSLTQHPLPAYFPSPFYCSQIS